MHRSRFACVTGVLLAAFFLAHGVASAEGVTRIQQSDGTVRVYDGVNLRLVGQTLWLRSHDHKGVLEVADGACSFAGELQRCLPYAATLHQHGQVHAIALEHGAVYLNLTNAVAQMPHSSQHLKPHQVWVLLHTMHGTYVSVKGTLDVVK